MQSPSIASLKNKILHDKGLDTISYRSLPDELKEDTEVTVAFLKKMPWLIKAAPQKFLKDTSLLLELMEKDPWVFSHINVELKQDVEFVEKAIEKTRGLAYFLCSASVASQPQIQEAARAQGLRLNG